MKNLLLVLFISSFTFIGADAQSIKKTKEPIKRELGIRFSSFDSFTLLYKKERKENKYLRLGFSSASLNAAEESFSAGLRVSVGFEKRKAITEKLSFLSGFNPFVNMQFSKSGDFNSFSGYLGLGYILGFQYAINDNFNIAIETIPSISNPFVFTNQDDSENNLDLSAYLSNRVGMTLVYKFVK